MSLDLRPGLLGRIITTSVIPLSSKTANESRPAEIRERPPSAPAMEPLVKVRAAPSAPRKTHVLDHPIAQHALTALRNRHTAAQEFRDFSNQLLLFLAMEATRALPAREEAVEGCAGPCTGKVLAKSVVFLSVTRRAMGLAHNVSEFIPDLLVGSISIDQSSGSSRPVPRLHLVNAPALADSQIILFDPVVATGLSASLALNLLRGSGASDIVFISFLVSAQGLARIHSTAPDLRVWTAAIDSDWDSKRGPMPGLGNFSERLYG